MPPLSRSGGVIGKRDKGISETCPHIRLTGRIAKDSKAWYTHKYKRKNGQG